MKEKINSFFYTLYNHKFSLIASVLAFLILLGFNLQDKAPLTSQKMLLLAVAAELFFFLYIAESARLKTIFIGLIFLLSGSCYAILDYLKNDFISVQVLAGLATIILVGSVAPDSNEKIWRWQNSLIKSAIEAVLIALAFILSGAAIVFLINFIFETKMNGLETLAKFDLTILCSMVFILRMKAPRDLENHFVFLVLNFLAIPLWIIYTLLLNIYALRILFTWSLPHGMVSIPIVFCFIFMILCWWLLENSKVFWPKKVLDYICYLHIPLLLLFALAIGRRVYDYGWTEHRSSIVMLLGFFAEILALRILKKLTMRKLAFSYWTCQALAFIPF